MNHHRKIERDGAASIWNGFTHTHTLSSLPRAGLVRELDAVGINLQDLNDVWVVGTHHM